MKIQRKQNLTFNVKKVFKCQPKNNFFGSSETDPTSSTITITSSSVWFVKQ